MKVRVEYEEHTRRVAVIECDSIDMARQCWAFGRHGGFVDRVEAAAVEVDGGIDWESAEFTEVTP